VEAAYGRFEARSPPLAPHRRGVTTSRTLSLIETGDGQPWYMWLVALRG
jgi:hypothetical protein